LASVHGFWARGLCPRPGMDKGEGS
jgi:hypothetical protein